MTEEIKEIEQYLKKCSNCFTCNNFLGEDENGGHCILQNAYNYITNLQKEKDNYKSRNEKASDFILSKVKEYKPHFAKVELNTADCNELLNILEGGDEE